MELYGVLGLAAALFGQGYAYMTPRALDRTLSPPRLGEGMVSTRMTRLISVPGMNLIAECGVKDQVSTGSRG